MSEKLHHAHASFVKPEFGARGRRNGGHVLQILEVRLPGVVRVLNLKLVHVWRDFMSEEFAIELGARMNTAFERLVRVTSGQTIDAGKVTKTAKRLRPGDCAAPFLGECRNISVFLIVVLCTLNRS